MNITVISQGTEEEGTLSILHYLSLINADVNLFIELKLYNRIKSNTNEYTNINYTIFTDENFLEEFRNKFSEIKKEIILIPRIDFRNKDEFSLYKELLKNNYCFVGLLDHDRWLSSIKDFLFSQLKRPSIAMFKDQRYCRRINKHIYGYLLFELDRTPQTVITKDILKMKKKFLSFPFKRPYQNFDLKIESYESNFIITGNIQEKRRDYFEVINIFDNNIFSDSKWSLTLLGRPIGKYGNDVIKLADKINNRLGRKAIRYYEDYIPKEEFDKALNTASHLIAPLNTELYKKGKTSGAIYDAISLNKHLIIPKKYFQDTGSIGLSTSIVYESSQELKEILLSIVSNNFYYDKLRSEAIKVKAYTQDSLYATHFKSHFQKIKYEI